MHDSTAEGGLGVDVERMRTMLALTAIHDVFKVDALLPKIERQTLHGGVGLLSGGTTPFTFEGFKVGDVVNDHDIALSYVLEYFPEFHAILRRPLDRPAANHQVHAGQDGL